MGTRGILLCAALLACTGAALGQPAFRAATQAVGTSATISEVGAGAFGQRTTCGDVNPTIPAGATGDMLIALVVARENGAVIAMAGWNLLYSDTPVGQEYQARVYWRLATGGDPNTVNQSGTCNTLIAQIARFDNVEQATPIEPGIGASFQNAGAVSSGTQATTVPGSMLIGATFVMANRTVAQGAGWTQSFERANDPPGGGPDPAGISLNYQLQAGTGSFSFTNWDLSGGGNSPNHGVLFALRPRQVLTLAVPGGTTTGDIMIAAVAAGPSTIGVSAPAGWTPLIATPQAAGNSNRQELFYRAVLAPEAGTYTWEFDAAPAGAVGGIATYSGVDLSSPIDVFAGNTTPAGGDPNTSHRATGVTTTVANTTVVSVHSFASAEPWTPPAGMSERIDIASVATPNPAGMSLGLNDVAQPAAGATGDKVATVAGNGDTGVAQILALRAGQTAVFDILSGDYALDCAAFPVEVTIIARDASTGDVIPGFANLVNISTAPAAGDWTVGTAIGALNNGAANDGAATYQFVAADSGRIVLRLATTTAGPLIVSVQDSTTGIASSGATITFVTDGYVVIPDPVQVAGRPQTVSVERRTSPGCGLAQGAGHNGNNGAKIWLSLDPSHPGAAVLPGATGVTAVNPLPTAEPGANNITLGFSGGSATFQLTSSDVGKYRINIRDTNTARRGVSPAITTRPFGLAMPGVSHSTNETSAPVIAAGSDFALSVGAYLWSNADDANNDGVPDAGADITNNGATPAFAWSTVLSVPAGQILPAGGTDGILSLGGAAPATVPSGSYANGIAALNNARYTEVGSAFVEANASGFLDTPGATVTGNSGLDGTGAAGGYIGRFRPSHFALSGGALTNRVALACGSTFTYMDEGLQLGFTLTARNAQNQTTVNYHGAYARLGLTTFANWNVGARSGTTDLTARVDTAVAPTGSWVNGVAASVAVTTGIRRPSAPDDDPDGPYPNLAFGIAPVDPDGTAMDAFDLDVDSNASDEHRSVGAATEARYGRLRVQNALGSERVTLPVRMETQYWDGSAFATNGDDGCTAIPRSAIALDFTGSTLAACQTAVAQATVTFAAGVAVPTLAAPGPNRGSVLLRANLRAAAGNYCAAVGGAFDPATSASMPYLLGRWNDGANPDANASTSYDDEPAARATFGLYGSQPNNFIYFKEVF